MYNRLDNQREKCYLFSDFQNSLESSSSITNLLMTAVSDRVSIFNRSGTTLLVAPDISKVFDKIWHVDLLPKLSGHVYGLILLFLSNRQLQVVLEGKLFKEHPPNAGDSQHSFLGPTLFLLYVNDFPYVICDIAVYVDTTFYSKSDLIYNLCK